ncbi:glutamate 5-kinase [Labilibaculum sp. A4]|uniref:glutamate 5-kinase n=1 Tax=Labilibaculum euxinus TaxID=2686357 RepID=UPI000F6287AA|nr:glutamate 5-kinase [Labilibaculum euxinus]MDQ1770316.1 glutamate 5-kinase [Labilibaculum euxinus]MWN75465.1 glutamate 5-kinase [Labilibaculum euxinus]
MKRICIKIGSNVLTKENGELNTSRIKNIVYQISSLRNMGIQCILVSSGAVAAGRSKVKLSEKIDTVSARQIWSSVGQVELLNVYSAFLKEFEIECAQVLVTKQDFRTREHYLNMKNCLNSLLNNRILPIINENDAVSVTALMFTDNDELSGLIASMMDVEALYLLSNINGIYTGNPDDNNSTLLQTVHGDVNRLKQYITTKKSNFGRGGMLTKCSIAGRVAKSGIPVHIANGGIDDIVLELVNSPDEINHTSFTASKKASTVKQWLAGSDGFEKARLVINKGAEEALCSKKATSLLPIGVIKISGDFEKGDIIKIVGLSGKVIGLGKTQYNKTKAESYIGKTGTKPLVHYDYLFLY